MASIISRFKKSKFRWKILLGLVTCVLLLNIFYLFTTPTNDGPWLDVYEKLASVEIVDDSVAISNFRRARYNGDGQPREIIWQERNVNLSELKEVWFGISVFAAPGLAHTFLSFDFGDGDPVVVSVEARQRPDQHYSPIDGALDDYHLIYTIADEMDIVGVRTHPRHNEVYFQPLTISDAFARTLFLDMIGRANRLFETPEFYNTFTSNCTNNLLGATTLPKWRRYIDPRIMLPGYSDRIAYEYDIIDTNYPLDVLRAAAHLNPNDFDIEDAEFYTKIRDSFYEGLEATPAP